MLTDNQKKLIQESWRLVAPIASTAADLFYQRLFELQPSYRNYFPDNLDSQKKKLMKMLGFMVQSLDWMQENWEEDINPEEDLFYIVLAMGRRHGQLYNIPDEAYAPAGEALIWALDYGLGDVFTKEVQESWTLAYNWMALTMKAGPKMTSFKQQKQDQSNRISIP